MVGKRHGENVTRAFTRRVLSVALVFGLCLTSRPAFAYDTNRATAVEKIRTWVSAEGLVSRLPEARAAQLGLGTRDLDGRQKPFNIEIGDNGGRGKVVFQTLRGSTFSILGYTDDTITLIWLLGDKGDVKRTVVTTAFDELGRLSDRSYEDFLDGTLEALSEALRDWQGLTSPDCNNIVSCTELINSGRFRSETLAKLYDKRAGYYRHEDEDRPNHVLAARDYGDAMKLTADRDFQAFLVWQRACVREAMGDKKGAMADFERGKKLGYQMPAEGWDARCGL